jgi:hypothetical protein
MSCTNLINILQGCDNNSGGIRTAYIFPQEDITFLTEDSNTWSVTGLTLSSTASVFNFRRNTSNYTEVDTIDLINGSSYVVATLEIMLHRREAAKSRALKIYGEGQRDLGIVVGDANGKYWLFQNMQLTEVGEGSGTARADGSKYSVAFTSENEFLAKEVPQAIALSII